MTEPKLEHWWVVECKSPVHQGYILMRKIANAGPYKEVLGALPPDAPCADWEESCPHCGALHKYNKGDVFSAKIDINEAPGLGSLAFRQAWMDSASRATEGKQE